MFVLTSRGKLIKEFQIFFTFIVVTFDQLYPIPHRPEKLM